MAKPFGKRGPISYRLEMKYVTETRESNWIIPDHHMLSLYYNWEDLVHARTELLSHSRPTCLIKTRVIKIEESILEQDAE